MKKYIIFIVGFVISISFFVAREVITIKEEIIQKLEVFEDDTTKCRRFHSNAEFESVYSYGYGLNNDFIAFDVYENNNSLKAKYAKHLTVQCFKNILNDVENQRFLDRGWFLKTGTPISSMELEKQISIFREQKSSMKMSQNYIDKYFYDCFLGDNLNYYRAEVLEFLAPLCTDNYLIFYLQREIRFGDNRTIIPLLKETQRRFGENNAEVALLSYNKFQPQNDLPKLKFEDTKNDSINNKFSSDKFKFVLESDYKFNWRDPMSFQFYFDL